MIDTTNNLSLNNPEVEHDYYYILGTAHPCGDPAREAIGLWTRPGWEGEERRRSVGEVEADWEKRGWKKRQVC